LNNFEYIVIGILSQETIFGVLTSQFEKKTFRPKFFHFRKESFQRRQTNTSPSIIHTRNEHMLGK